MRGIRPRDDIEQHILPTSVCKKTFNIYDPTDPVVSPRHFFTIRYRKMID